MGVRAIVLLLNGGLDKPPSRLATLTECAPIAPNEIHTVARRQNGRKAESIADFKAKIVKFRIKFRSQNDGTNDLAVPDKEARGVLL